MSAAKERAVLAETHERKLSIDELIDLLERYQAENALLKKKLGGAERVWLESANPHRVLQALGFTTGRRGSSKMKSTIVSLYMATSGHPECGPVRAIQVISKAFGYKTDEALRKALIRWREHRSDYKVPGEATLADARGARIPRAKRNR